MVWKHADDGRDGLTADWRARFNMETEEMQFLGGT